MLRTAWLSAMYDLGWSMRGMRSSTFTVPSGASTALPASPLRAMLPVGMRAHGMPLNSG